MAKQERTLTEAEALGAIRLLSLAYERELIRAWVTKKSLIATLIEAGKEHVGSIRKIKVEAVAAPQGDEVEPRSAETYAATSEESAVTGDEETSESEACPPPYQECWDGSCAISCELEI